MSTVKAVIFDLDDTLYPEREYAFSGYAAVATAFQDRLGDPGEAAAAMQRLFDTQHRRRVFDALLAERGLERDSRLIGKMIEVYRRHRPTITLHPDADAALTHLGAAFKLGLITDGPPESQWAKIDALGLRTRFDEIIVTSELSLPDAAASSARDEAEQYAKPHPRSFTVMVERLGIEAAACVYVADNSAKDFIAPNALGWTTVRIIRRDGIYRDAQPVRGGAPRFTIGSLSALDPILR